jgi:hypothetical protein
MQRHPAEADELEALKGAFLAKGGQITQAPAAPAYGVDPEADRIRREAERDRLEAARSLRECERHAERVREAYHVGGRTAALNAMQAPARWRF